MDGARGGAELICLSGLSHLTIEPASLSRRNTVPAPGRDTIKQLTAQCGVSMYDIGHLADRIPFLFRPPVAIIIIQDRKPFSGAFVYIGMVPPTTGVEQPNVPLDPLNTLLYRVNDIIITIFVQY